MYVYYLRTLYLGSTNSRYLGGTETRRAFIIVINVSETKTDTLRLYGVM